MRYWFLCLLFCGFGALAAQTISNIRISQDAELGYYKVNFELIGKAGETYKIKAIPFKGSQEIQHPRYLSGDGIEAPCNPRTDLQIFWHPTLEGLDKDGWQFRLSTIAVPQNMVFVKGGTFNMGSNEGKSAEKPVNPVTVSSFYIGKYEVTQKEWQEVMGNNSSYWKGNDLPVETVSWYDAVEYCKKRSIKEGFKPCYIGSGEKITCDWTANGYRLPTETEWEYAARGGNQSKGYTYAGSNNIDMVAWFDSNSGSKTHTVGIKTANELGLYDMSGNVWEWCWDWYDSGYYTQSQSSDPKGAGSGSYKVLRGGSWNYVDSGCRVAYRYYVNPDFRNNYFGFRVLRAN